VVEGHAVVPLVDAWDLLEGRLDVAAKEAHPLGCEGAAFGEAGCAAAFVSTSSYGTLIDLPCIDQTCWEAAFQVFAI
jgi:hypothetical protein